MKYAKYLIYNTIMKTEIHTPRLQLRPFRISDAEEVFRLNGHPEVMRYLFKDEVYSSPEQATQFLEKYLAADVPFSRWAVISRDNGDWLGWCGLKQNDNGEVDLGFRFHYANWGQGYATESGKAWLAYGFGPGQLKEIVGNAAEGNLGSQKVLTKLGLSRAPERDFQEGAFNWFKFVVTNRI
jgi:RimJ/RimL family protein N-acetyltransferase